MIYYCSIYSANMSSTNALQVARTDIQSGEKTESLSKLKLSTWWPIHAHANTYARLGSGAPQSAQMQFSLFCNNSFISFAIFAGRQRWMWVDNISETAMTLISKKLESLEGKNYICIFGSSCVHYHEHICVCSRLVQNIPVRAPANYATPLHDEKNNKSHNWMVRMGWRRAMGSKRLLGLRGWAMEDRWHQLWFT